MSRNPLTSRAFLVVAFSLLTSPVTAQRVPHNQDRPPGPPLSPEEALKKFQLPEGFRVELVASEPDIVNPIKMCFDARGRIWLVESLEYPRRSAGPGRDRIKILEDTDGDGKTDTFKIFAEGLNIPCGIALGHGGVFVTNSPDILFLEDTDGDDRADRRTVVLTGFGRHDTHELPNTLTWGPDGWLYGLNGVFNPARVEQNGKTHEFTCALWRYHPRTRDFELFAEGTSNPWGVGFDREGAAFIEACVIDHLYHLTETGYYHRQGGRYPPFTWKIESVVKHRNYKAAYCGLDFYDADVYPAEYRGRVYYGNIHGNCINADRLERRGSTYFAGPAPIILKTDDVWFMPVDIRLGPDGCFYVLDWYDRYHCYQDARRDPQGIDRGRGRLWRIAYGKAPVPRGYDLAKESSPELIARLAAANRWWRDEARRLLRERRKATTFEPLRRIVLDATSPRHVRLQAFWTLLGCDDPGRTPAAVDRDFHLKVLALADSSLRAWGVRAAGNLRRVAPAVVERVQALARDPHPDVRLQVAIASRKLLGAGSLPVLLEVLSRSTDDPLIPRIVWRNLEPLLEERGGDLVNWLAGRELPALTAVEALLGRVVERLMARRAKDDASLARLVGLLLRDPARHEKVAAQCLGVLSRSLASGEMDASTLNVLRPGLSDAIETIRQQGAESPLYLPAMTVAASWREPAALEACRSVLDDPRRDAKSRGAALRALLVARDPSVLDFASRVLRSPAPGSRRPEDAVLVEVLSALGKLDDPEVARIVLAGFGGLPAAVRPRAIDLLSQRVSWARAFLDEVAAGKIDSKQLNVTQVRRLLALGDAQVSRRVTATWGKLREGRNPEREKVIVRLRKVLERGEGDPWRGKQVYEKTCAQCHVIFGEGQNVGPDVTVNGRETLDLLLSNLLDPNLVVGKDYFAHNLLTTDGRALTGLLVEDSPQRVVLRVAGGKEEVVPRKQVLQLELAEVSLMPEDLEKTVTEQEFRDLIAFLRYDEAPPPPVPTRKGDPTEQARIRAEQEYGVVRVEALFPGSREPVELLRYHHSNDGRPFIHPLKAPRGGPALTALRPEDRPWESGVFTAHPRVNGIDFWSEKGWVRSRGLRAVTQTAERVEIVSRSDWLTQRRGGRPLLEEEQRITVHAPTRPDRYAVDVEWRIKAVVDVTLERADHGGLAFRAAAHRERRHAQRGDDERHPWQSLSGRFGPGRRRAGVALLDHPDNPGFPSTWRLDRQGLVNPSISAREPVSLDAGESITYRYRLLVHDGHGERRLLEEEYRRWAERPGK